MKDYATASFPVLCKNGAWGDASSGRKLVSEDAANGIVRYSSEKRKTLNQKLKEKLYGYAIVCNDQTSLCFEVHEASRINKHGLIWDKVFSAVFRARDRSPTETLSDSRHIEYWLGDEGVQLLCKNALVRAPDIPSVEKLCRSMWGCKKPSVRFPSDPLELLKDWMTGELELRIKNVDSIFNNINNFLFGLELEFTGISRDAAARTIANTFGTTKSYKNDTYHTHVIVDEQQREWKIMRDGSITPSNSRNTTYTKDHYRCELVTPILRYETDIPLLKRVVKALKQRGAVTNTSCGIHIHVDVHFNAVQLRNLANIVASKEDLLKRAIQMHAERNPYCHRSNMAFVESINYRKNIDMDFLRDEWYDGRRWRMNQHYDSSRYVTLNLHSLWQGKGVEFRCFNSTMDTRLINAYILLSLAICNQAARQNRASYNASKSHDRVAMNNWLNQLGFVGSDFRSVRHIMLRHLSDTQPRIA